MTGVPRSGNPSVADNKHGEDFRLARQAHAKAMGALGADVHPYSGTAIREWEHELDAALTRLSTALEAAEADARQKTEKLERALYLAEHLHQMVPREVWRDTGGDDGQGHYEGDYHAEKIGEEIRSLQAALGRA